MPKYKFTEHAEHDLDGIIEYTVKQWGKPQALSYVDGLEELLVSLANKPLLGTKQDKLFSGLYSFPYKSHLVYYQEDRDGITVIRILHKRMDTRQKLSETLPKQ